MRHLKRVASFVITLLLCVESLLDNGAYTAMALGALRRRPRSPLVFP